MRSINIFLKWIHLNYFSINYISSKHPLRFINFLLLYVINVYRSTYSIKLISFKIITFFNIIFGTLIVQVLLSHVFPEMMFFPLFLLIKKPKTLIKRKNYNHNPRIHSRHNWMKHLHIYELFHMIDNEMKVLIFQTILPRPLYIILYYFNIECII